VRRTFLLVLGLDLLLLRPAAAGTFGKAPIAPELGVDAFTRGVARERVGRSVFSNPWATVTLGSVDVYPTFPYVQSRHFQIVSDPRWNRLVYGEAGRVLRAWDGRGGALGALSEPRGLAVDERDRVYVADAGNDRVVVLQAAIEQGEIALAPLFEIRGLARPHDLAFSDGGTPFRADDDVLYVADTGRNRVLAYALEPAGARQVAAIGELGGGPGRFAGPMAIAVGRANGGSTRDVYVADAHSRRIAHLRHAGARLDWVSETSHGAEVVTSLATDQWGNVYAAAPRQGVVLKYNPALEAVAELRSDLDSPRGVHLPFVNVRDHRSGSVARVGLPNALTLDRWSDDSGLRLWSLGADVTGLAVDAQAGRSARFVLTDPAQVSVAIRDARDGRVLARRDAGTLAAGAHALPLSAEDLAAAGRAAQPMVVLSARSTYPGGATITAEAPLAGLGGVAILAARPMLLPNQPNPVRSSTRIGFVVPAGVQGALGVFDASGRMVRSLGRGFAPGMNEVVWDGADDHHHPVAAGVYFFRLLLGPGQPELSHKMVVVR
jgi:hypothetical protein